MPLTAVDAFLPVVDGLGLPSPHRDLLQPGSMVRSRDGEYHRLPRYFYEIESWALAMSTPLTPHFGLWEFMNVDLHEPAALRALPRYIPCAVSLLAAALEVVRLEVGAPVRIMANGGYRSPAHAGSASRSPHCWGTAANIHRIGPDSLDTPDRIERYALVVRRLLPFAWVRPSGEEIDVADDHLHVDIGYVTLVPRGAREQGHESSGAGA